MQHPSFEKPPSNPWKEPSSVRKQICVRSVLTLNRAASLTTSGRSLSHSARTNATVSRSSRGRSAQVRSTTSQASP